MEEACQGGDGSLHEGVHIHGTGRASSKRNKEGDFKGMQ